MQLSAPRSESDGAGNPFDAIAARMESLAGGMSENDGVRIFNDLYLAVTRAVGVEFANGRFEDPAFFSRLAPVFSKLYFEAFERDAAMGTLSRVWAPLFEKRSEAGIAPLQFAIAGMSAHINYDLVIALATAARELGYDLELDSAHHRDHLRVNTTLARVMDDLKEGFETGIARTVVQGLGTLDQIRIIERARDRAWTRAQNLVALDNAPFMREQYLLVLARTVGFASRALLGLRWARPAAATARAGPRCSRPAATWRSGASA
jgi:Family of unknown function (DUF5995)